MFSSRAPSNPDGPRYAYLPQMDTRMASRFKYTGPQTNIYGVDILSPLGRAFFHADNIHIIRAELYSRAVQSLRGKMDKASIFQPSDAFLQKKCHELYPMYAPIVHQLGNTPLSSQIRALNAHIISQSMPNYISLLTGNQHYLKSLTELPVSTRAPTYNDNTGNRELMNRSVRMGVHEDSVFSSQNTRVQSAHAFHKLPYNPWLASRMPRLYGDNAMSATPLGLSFPV